MNIDYTSKTLKSLSQSRDKLFNAYDGKRQPLFQEWKHSEE